MSPLPLPFVDYAKPEAPKKWNRIVLVGEAPGREEVKQGQPFVGRSGQLLNEMLERAEIERSACIVANVFRYQPPGNKVDHFFSSLRAAKESGESVDSSLGKFGSLWCKSVFSSEISALRDLLQATSPAVILALGRTPLWALTGQQGILSLAGQQVEGRLAPGIPVIPTYHPSYILRGNWGKKDEWLGHFLTAKAFATHSVA